jgi:UDP:flavonoid glycosyltransferase YjiC (YdhE family)
MGVPSVTEHAYSSASMPSLSFLCSCHAQQSRPGPNPPDIMSSIIYTATIQYATHATFQARFAKLFFACMRRRTMSQTAETLAVCPTGHEICRCNSTQIRFSIEWSSSSMLFLYCQVNYIAIILADLCPIAGFKLDIHSLSQNSKSAPLLKHLPSSEPSMDCTPYKISHASWLRQ